MINKETYNGGPTPCEPCPGLPPDMPGGMDTLCLDTQCLACYPDGADWEEPEDDYSRRYGDWDPLDDIPWGTPDSWIPDNPDENGMRQSDFL